MWKIEPFQGRSFLLTLSTGCASCEHDVETMAECVPQQITKESIK